MSEGLEQAVEAPEVDPETTPDLEVQASEPDLEQEADITGDQEGADEAKGDESAAAAEEEGVWRQDPDVLDYAASAGIPPDELEDYRDFYELERDVRNVDRRRRAGLQREAPPPQEEPPPKAPAKPAELQALDREMIDEPIAAAIETRDKYYEGKIGALTEQFEEVLAHFQQQAWEAEARNFHRVVDSLEGFGHLLGKSAEQIVPGSKEARNRQRVFDAYCYLENRQPTKAMIQRAINQEFWSELKTEERRQFRTKAEKQRKRVLPGKTRRSSAAGPPEEPQGGLSDKARTDLAEEVHRKYGPGW